jgi:hypothetical protein
MQTTDKRRAVGARRLQHGVVIGLLALAACATPRERIADKLIASGLPPTQARCVADRMVNELSGAQLRRVAAAAKPGRYGRLTLGEFVGRLQTVSDDPQIARTLTGAAINCVVLG